jgi:hypothetical protein
MANLFNFATSILSKSNAESINKLNDNKNQGGIMIKKMFALVVIALYLASCGGNAPKTEEIVKITVDDFSANPDLYADKQIEITGTATHVCKEGGKRLFIIGTDPEQRVKIETGKELSSFPVELEGSDVVVTGTVSKLVVDEAYLTNWENEIKANNPGSDFKIHEGQVGHEAHEGDPSAELEQVNNLRTKIAESGSDHLTFFTIIASKFDTKK